MKKGIRRAAGPLALLLLCGAHPWGRPGQVQYRGNQESLPRSVAPQPVAFSHRLHAEAEIGCEFCHVDAADGVRAGLPGSRQCMDCHQVIGTESPEVQKLAALHGQSLEGAEPLEWVRVYEVPGFVFFSHASHVGAGVECASCHGPVERREVLAKELSTSMITCMNCHERRGVSNECFLCHELGQ